MTLASCAHHSGDLPADPYANSTQQEDANVGGPQKIDREGIRQTFIDHQKQIQACYGTLLKSDLANKDKYQGKFVLDFDIGGDGKITRMVQATDKSTLINPTLLKCIADHAAQWQFPKPPPKQTVQVFYPLKFSKN
jgi:hypothetical protein